MLYPFLNDIGKIKVSEALPTLSVIAKDWNQNFSLVPKQPDGKPAPYKAVWFGNAFTVVTRIMRNCQRNN